MVGVNPAESARKNRHRYFFSSVLNPAGEWEIELYSNFERAEEITFFYLALYYGQVGRGWYFTKPSVHEHYAYDMETHLLISAIYDKRGGYPEELINYELKLKDLANTQIHDDSSLQR
jgi:hypothetical protein